MAPSSRSGDTTHRPTNDPVDDEDEPLARTRERAEFDFNESGDTSLSETTQSGSPRAADLLADTVVGDFRIEGILGRGATGIVYRAEQITTGAKAAFKVLKPAFAAEPEYIRRLIEEARALSAIRHKGIIDILDFGSLPNGQPYLAMELCNGLSLEEQLKFQGKLTPEEALGFLDELVDALGAAHACGIIHRDLKPSNLFVASYANGTRKKLKVLDFGLARRGNGRRPNPTKPGTMLGTPDYMAPEQVEAAAIGPFTDVYAVGGIAFLLLTNRLPFVMPTGFAVITKKMAEPAPRMRVFDPKVPAALDDLVNQMLARKPADRPSLDKVRAVILAAREGRGAASSRTAADGSSDKTVSNDAAEFRAWREAEAAKLSPLASPPQAPTHRALPMLQDPNEGPSTAQAFAAMKSAGTPRWMIGVGLSLGAGVLAAIGWYLAHR